MIAVDPDTGQSFGTARYVRSDEDPGSAEFAVGVGDRWMRIGLGTALLGALVGRAREVGIVRFTGLIHPDNAAIRRLVEKVAGPYETRVAGPGAIEMVVDLRTGEPSDTGPGGAAFAPAAEARHSERSLHRSPVAEETLRAAYRAFNARDTEAALELMDPDVNWPNALEGGRVVGREAVRDYWAKQFAAISSRVEPESFTREADGRITVEVHQAVHDVRSGELVSDSHVRHRYQLEDGLVVRMDVLGEDERA